MSGNDITKPDKPSVRVEYEDHPPLDNWMTLAEIAREPIYPVREGQPSPVAPRVVVRQHRDTRELRIDVYDCEGGFYVTDQNGGTGDTRAKWFRDLLTCRDGFQPQLRIRVLAGGSSRNLDLIT